MRSEIRQGFANCFASFARVNRREALKVFGTGALGAPIAVTLKLPHAQAPDPAPTPPQPTRVSDRDPEEEPQKAVKPLNPCGMTSEPKQFTGPFQTNQITYIVSSHNQTEDLPLRVLLPDKLGDIDSPKVLYVLPAEPGVGYSVGECLLTVEHENLHNKYGLIAVSPSFSDWPWYANHPKNPEIQQETYFVKEIVPFIDRLYPKASSVRLLVGMSKSGNGAYQMLLRHPDLFHAAAIFDSPIMYNSATQFETPRIYGDGDDGQETFDEYCIPQLLLDRADLFRGKPPRLALFGYCLFGGPSPKFGPHHQEAHALMESLGIPHIYDDSTCRNHRWDSGWLEEAAAALDKMSRSLL
jgi:hypothetical protein